MTINRGNNTRLDTEPLTDETGAPIMPPSQVKSEILSEDGATVYFAEADMTHVGDGGTTHADGTWRRELTAANVNANIPATVRDVLHRVTVYVSGTLAATRERVEAVEPWRSP